MCPHLADPPAGPSRLLLATLPLLLLLACGDKDGDSPPTGSDDTGGPDGGDDGGDDGGEGSGSSTGDEDDTGDCPPTTWYADADADGHGDAESTTEACEDPSDGTTSWVSGPADDCDDGDPAVHPGARELCEDEVDQDCDGSVDETCGDIDDAPIIITGVVEEADFGYQVVVLDADGDGQDDLVASAYQDEGVSWLVPGPLTAGIQSVDDVATATVTGTDGERAGTCLASPGDVDGDGYEDLVISATHFEDTEDSNVSGRVGLFHGPISGAQGLDEAELLVTTDNQRWLGQVACGSPGDVDGDGVVDLFFGSYSATGSPGYTGFLFAGTTTGSLSAPEAPTRFWSPSNPASMGSVPPTTIDLDSDGIDDLVMALGTGYRMAAFTGPVTAGTWTDEDAAWLGPVGDGFDYVGSQLATGDLDDDGHADLIASGPGWDGVDNVPPAEDNRGEFRIYAGPVGEITDLDDFVAAVEGPGQGADLGDRFDGMQVVDLDQDGVDDLLMGCRQTSTPSGQNNGGAIYASYGPLSGRSSVVDADFAYRGYHAHMEVGIGVATGDLDGDGLIDVVTGSESRLDTGVVYVLPAIWP